MRFAWKVRCALVTHLIFFQVQPRNTLLFICHVTNETAQAIQMARFFNRHYLHIWKEKDYSHDTIVEKVKQMPVLGQQEEIAEIVYGWAYKDLFNLAVKSLRRQPRLSSPAESADYPIEDERNRLNVNFHYD